jgi:sulfatase maturation enzyme AslB (radical SAM superfamily)
LLDSLTANGIEVGLVTNGCLLGKHKESLAKCRWVGVSVDAGNSSVFPRLKNMPPEVFDKVMRNIAELHAFAPDLEITYKFLAHPENILSVYEAVKRAKELGCRFFHLRPVGKCWDCLGQPNIFSPLDIAVAKTQVEQARMDFEDGDFHVFSVIHKFSGTWEIQHSFKKCHAVAMTAVIQPDNTISLCCDRRGDPRMELGTFEKLEDITQLWGSPKHFDIMHRINLKDCPRCTYGPHNQLFEHMVLTDDTCKNFI